MRRCGKCKKTEEEMNFGAQKSKCKSCVRDEYKRKHHKICLECKKVFVANRPYCSMRCAIIGKTIKNEFGCWNWTGAKDRNGYGFIKRYNSRKMIKTHRASYEIFNGIIPPGICVCHSCDNPSCCNPSHLWLGTVKQNTKDAYDKGLLKPPMFNAIGVKNASAKLNDIQVIEIRKLYSSGLSQQKIAKMFSVSQSLISKIIRAYIWGHI